MQKVPKGSRKVTFTLVPKFVKKDVDVELTGYKGGARQSGKIKIKK